MRFGIRRTSAHRVASRPALLELQVFGSALIEATQAGCKAAGRSGEQVELHQAMRALLERDEHT